MFLISVLWIGLLGAVLMLVGDMVLYYDKNDYDSSKGIAAVIDIMKRVVRRRLYVGGILGPISAFLYCIGYYHIVLFSGEGHEMIAWIAFLSSCLGIICGGAFHSQCANLGLMTLR